MTQHGTLLYKGSMKEDTSINEIRKGLLVLAVLQVIGRKKSYAADILAELNAGEFATQEGTLYPLLSRLKREGLIDHEWVESAGGPPRKYYVLNTSGQARARALMDYLGKLEDELKALGQRKHSKGAER